MHSKVNVNILCQFVVALAFLLFSASGALGQFITVKPGQLDKFTVSAPAEAVSGEDFFLQIKAHDNKGNIITNYSDVGKSVTLHSSGTQQLVPKSLSAASFIGGVATVKAVYYKAEGISITVKDFSGKLSGKSSLVRVRPSTIHHFSILAPPSATAGKGFTIKITAFDAYDNVISNYNSLGKGVNVSTSGTSKVSPNFIAASSFINGVASVAFSYTKAENITINLSEKDRPDISKSNRINIQPDSLERFVVTAGGVAIAGESFTLQIKAVDAYDNVINNFNSIGKDVVLESTGSGTLSPNVVKAASFLDGLATVRVRYDKAESFSINVYQEGLKVPVKRVPPKSKPVVPEKVVEKKAPQGVKNVPPKPTQAQGGLEPVSKDEVEIDKNPPKDDFSDMLILD